LEFSTKLENIVKKNLSILTVGLDPDKSKMPIEDLFEFNKRIIDSTIDLVCAYKPNFAFYESEGLKGIKSLYDTVDYIKSKNSDVITIADAKRGDIGNTSKQYAYSIFENMGFDAVTVNPYGGEESLQPFFEYKEKGIFVWCRSSNPLSDELQKLKLDASYGVEYFYEYLAILLNRWHSTNNNVGLVAGATNIDDIKRLKKICGELTYLIPGIGSQGGDIDEVISSLGKINLSLKSKNIPYLINSSRSIIYSSNGKDFDNAAREAAISFNDNIKKSVFVDK
tara:strand:+ start:1430 stop:2272 length:843 start_codon:yes stop_codon:yes gene_type:complete